MNEFTDACVFVTGGTGFIGSRLIQNLLYEPVKKVVAFSRRWADSEQLLREMNDPRLRCINGDICDHHVLNTAMSGADLVFHTAAYKSVPSGEYNPFEVSRVNIHGTEQVIRSALENKVKKVMFISSDKACDAVNLYGHTKAVGESLIINANNLGNTRFSVARYGNVLGSTGSLFPIILELSAQNKPIPVTDWNMTRFWFPPLLATAFVGYSMRMMVGGEIFIPKLSASTLRVFFDAFDMYTGKSHEYVSIGVRPGEKMHEAMISPIEAQRVLEYHHHFIIPPFQHDWDKNWEPNPLDRYIINPPQFAYNSNNAPQLSASELLSLLQLT